MWVKSNRDREMKKKKKEKVSENNGQLCFHGSPQDKKSVKTMTSFAFVSHHSWSTQAALAKKSVKTMASFASTEAAWSNFSFLSIPIPIEKKEEQKSVLTMVSTNAWTNNTEFDNLGSICLKEIVFESLYE